MWVVHPQGRTAPDEAACRPASLDIHSGRALVRRPTVERRLDEDRVLIDVTGKAAYVLNPTAWASWELCDGQRSANQIVSELASRYAADEATVADELAVLPEVASGTGERVVAVDEEEVDRATAQQRADTVDGRGFLQVLAFLEAAELVEEAGR